MLTAYAVAGVLPFMAAAQSATEFNDLGIAAYDKALWSDAVQYFERAYDQAPSNDVVRKNLSNAYQAMANELAKKKDMAKAEHYLTLAIGVDPENAQPLIQLGAYYLQEGLIPEAVFRLEEAVQLAPRNVDAHHLLGEAYFRDNDATSALDQWEWVLEVDPSREELRERMDQAIRQENVEYHFDARESRNFKVSFAPGTHWGDVRAVLEVLELARQSVGRDLGHQYPPGPIQVTLYSSEDFSETTQMGDHVGALYDGSKIRVPVSDKDGQPVDIEELRRRLIHEYVHVVVRYVGRDNVPWWFNEGLAELMARSVAPGEFEQLRAVKRDTGLVSFFDLADNQLEKADVSALQLAYRQSHAAVQFLRDKYGMRQLSQYLQELGAGTVPEDALTLVFRLNYQTLDRAVGDYIEQG